MRSSLLGGSILAVNGCVSVNRIALRGWGLAVVEMRCKAGRGDEIAGFFALGDGYGARKRDDRIVAHELREECEFPRFIRWAKTMTRAFARTRPAQRCSHDRNL
jgi:hypothetical protein